MTEPRDEARDVLMARVRLLGELMAEHGMEDQHGRRWVPHREVSAMIQAIDPATGQAILGSPFAARGYRLAATGADVAQPRTPYGVVPANCRLILASDNLLDEWGTRTERGERITAEWGEPSPEGWYEPVFTVHSDDVLQHWPAAIRAGAPEP